MNLLLSENLPLRSSRQLGNYLDSKPLGRRYGDLRNTRFPMLKLSDTKAFAADHRMRLTDCYVGDLRSTAWEQAFENDNDGNVWTVVNFAAPIPTDKVVSGSGLGVENRKTGALIENPADVFEDYMSLAGRSSNWGRLRSECAAAGIVIAHSIDSEITIGGALDDVARNIGAIWTPNNASLYPADITGYIAELDRQFAADIKLSESLTDTCDILQIGFDYDYATNRPQKHLTLSANPQRFGGVTEFLELPMIRIARLAEEIGSRLLRRMNGERFRVFFNSSEVSLRPGSSVRLVDPIAWPFDDGDPVVKVLQVNVNYAANSTQVIGEYQRTVPAVTLTAHSYALSVTSEESIQVAFENGVAEIQLLDKDKRPLSNVHVSLDNGLAETTNEQGIVRFETTIGEHKLTIERAGYDPQTITIFLGGRGDA